jgi:hypothetical protein
VYGRCDPIMLPIDESPARSWGGLGALVPAANRHKSEDVKVNQRWAHALIACTVDCTGKC